MIVGVVNHGVGIGLGYAELVEVRARVGALLRVVAAGRDLIELNPHVHPRAFEMDCGGLTLGAWLSKFARDRDLGDAAMGLVRLVGSGPFLDLGAAEVVERASISPPIPGGEFGELVQLALAERATGGDAVVLSVGDAGSAVAEDAYNFGDHRVVNLRMEALALQYFEDELTRSVAEHRMVTAAVERVAPRIRFGPKAIAALEGGGLEVSPGRLIAACVGLQAMAEATAKGEDGFAALQRAAAVQASDESTSVLQSPSYRGLRRFPLADGRKCICSWHVKFGRARLHFLPEPGVVHVAYIGPHLKLPP